MSKQDKQEPNNQQPMIEDLAVNEDQAKAVKGGPTRSGGGGADIIVFDIVDS